MTDSCGCSTPLTRKALSRTREPCYRLFSPKAPTRDASGSTGSTTSDASRASPGQRSLYQAQFEEESKRFTVFHPDGRVRLDIDLSTARWWERTIRDYRIRRAWQNTGDRYVWLYLVTRLRFTEHRPCLPDAQTGPRQCPLLSKPQHRGSSGTAGEHGGVDRLLPHRPPGNATGTHRRSGSGGLAWGLPAVRGSAGRDCGFGTAAALSWAVCRWCGWGVLQLSAVL